MSLFPSTEKKPFCRTYAKEKRCNLKKDYNASENPYSILPDVSICPLFRLLKFPLRLLLQSVPNDGNLEYLKDRENCIMYNRGDIQEAVKLIEEISENSELRHSLYIKGIETARKRDWKNIEKRVKEVYIGGRV